MLLKQSQELAEHGEQFLCSCDRTLVIVDMQPGFSASMHARTLAQVERRIVEAVSHGWAIVVLENESHLHGHTLPRLIKHLIGYKRCIVIPKADDDGSREVIAGCQVAGFDLNFVEVCGVNTDACVKATVEGLIARSPFTNILVFRKACYSDTPDGMWSDFPVARNLVVVPAKSAEPYSGRAIRLRVQSRV